jgi:hypothetical protein
VISSSPSMPVGALVSCVLTRGAGACAFRLVIVKGSVGLSMKIPRGQMAGLVRS